MDEDKNKELKEMIEAEIINMGAERYILYLLFLIFRSLDIFVTDVTFCNN